MTISGDDYASAAPAQGMFQIIEPNPELDLAAHAAHYIRSRYGSIPPELVAGWYAHTQADPIVRELRRHFRAAERRQRPIALLVRHYGDFGVHGSWYWCVHVPGPAPAQANFGDPHLEGRRIVHDGWADTWGIAISKGLLCIGEDVPVARLDFTPLPDGHTLVEGAGPARVLGPNDTLSVANPQRTRISAQGHTIVAPGLTMGTGHLVRTDDTPPPRDTPSLHTPTALLPQCLRCWPAVRMNQAHDGSAHYTCPRCGLTSGAPTP